MNAAHKIVELEAEVTRLRAENAAMRERLGDVEAERNLMYTVLDDIRKEFGVSKSAIWFLRNNAKVLVQDLRSANRRAERAEAERDEEIARVVRITERLGAETLRADRAERILAALREPSEAIVDAVNDLGDLSQLTYTVISVAVAVAEQEVGQ